MDNTLLYKKISSLPDHLKKQVEDFIDFLNRRKEPTENQKPKFGSGKGMFVMKPDFDEPLDDFREYMH
jgi:hypothetical protein